MSKRSHLDDFRSRTRRTLWWCVFILFFSPIPGSWLIDHCPDHIRDPESGAAVALWEKANPHPNVLILGSSRMGSFLRTAELRELVARFASSKAGNIFNATLPNEEPIAISFLTRKLLASKAPPPRLVLLEVSPDLLSRNNAFLKYVISRNLVTADLPSYLGEISLSSVSIWKLISSRLAPFFIHRSQFVNWATETVSKRFAIEEPSSDATASASIEALSFQSERDTWEKSPVPFAGRVQLGTRRYRSRLLHYELAGHTPAAFEATVAMLHARGCAIVFVQPPLSSAHRALLTNEVRRPFGDFLRRLQDCYGCEFVDFSDRFPDTLFVDNQHANNAGSRAFTDLLAEEVISPAWRKLVEKSGE